MQEWDDTPTIRVGNYPGALRDPRVAHFCLIDGG
jgi:hypothetical protein